MDKRNQTILFLIIMLLVVMGGVSISGSYFQAQQQRTSTSASNPYAESSQLIITEPPVSGQPNLQLRTFKVITYTPAPTQPYGSHPTPNPNSPNQPQPTNVPPPPGIIITGGPVGPNSPYYCIDDVNADGCDDKTSFWVPKGAGGRAGRCGTVISWAHKIVDSLPNGQQYLKALRDKLNPSVTSPCYPQGTGTYPYGYISTFFVIDAFNLAGYHQLSKTNPQHVLGSDLLSWWGTAIGYKFIPYTPTVLKEHASGQQDLTGCVMFINLSSGVFPGIVNVLEADANGNGVISMLQSGVSFYVDRFEVVGWDIKNTVLHLPNQGESKNIQGVAGFGCLE